MKKNLRIAVVIPALNEGRRIAEIVTSSLAVTGVVQVVVGNNGSTDNTKTKALDAGATVVDEPIKGYGSACKSAIGAIDQPVDAVLFINADGAESIQESELLIEALAHADLVVGSRSLGRSEAGAVLPQQRFGNWLSCYIMHFLWGAHFTDLGPFRIIRYSLLDALKMQDKDFGWIIEMQLKSIFCGARIVEVPVTTTCSEEPSKISGTFVGATKAAYKILFSILYFWFRQKLGSSSVLSLLYSSGEEYRPSQSGRFKKRLYALRSLTYKEKS